MNIEAIRRALLMSTAEAAKLLAVTDFAPKGVSETAWNRWERGVKPIPDDVKQHINSVLKQRETLLLPQIERLQIENVTVQWQSHCPETVDKLTWFITRSVNAELIALGAKWEIKT